MSLSLWAGAKVPQPSADKGNFVVRNLRIHREFIERLNQLTDKLEASGEYAPGGPLKEGDKLSLAVRVGIETLEERTGGKKG